MQRPAKLFEAPEIGGNNMLFSLKEIIHTPEAPKMGEAFTVRGKVELFGIPFLAPVWVIATVTYPEQWWEVIGSPSIAEGTLVIGGDFEISFPRGFEREGEYSLEVALYGGPTYGMEIPAIGKAMTMPPFPPMASEKTTFTVSGEVVSELDVVEASFS